MAEMMRVLIPLPRSWTRSLKKELNTLRCMFENACQGMHKHCTYSFDRDTLVDIFYRGPIFRNVKDSIFKLNESMQANLHKYYAASVMYDVISIIIALLLFICQSSLGSATDMKQLMIFATVIHLIISGDVEINPGPEYDAADLYQKKPKISDLHRIFVKSKAASTWKTIDIALETEVDDSLIDGSSSAADKLGSVFKKWRQRGKDFTWGKIIQVCEDYDELGAVHHAIFEFLSSPEAHSEYGSEPDFDRTFTGRPGLAP
uniref:Death domain-containing protein n=1 Tax=Amphimedon queenslandica TaxID=400682 RepID=A0A1X7TTX3_AMPQE